MTVRYPDIGLVQAWLMTFVLLALAVVLRSWLVQGMAMHMLVHIPLLLVSGLMLAKAISLSLMQCEPDSIWRRISRQAAVFNEHGIPGLLYASLASMYWMIPKALDDVLLSGTAEFGKFLSVIVAGAWLYDSWRRADRIIKLFFVGGFCWVSAIAGMLYQESSTRLCNFYLLNDQVWAGQGLVILAIVIPIAWLFAEVRQHRRNQFDRVS